MQISAAFGLVFDAIEYTGISSICNEGRQNLFFQQLTGNRQIFAYFL